ncbi:MAG: DUF3817 domain-containing protein [Acidimicrobiales bacterium]
MSLAAPDAHAALRRYRVIAYIVGTLLLILTLIGIPLQLAAGQPEVVSLVGPIHGFAYIIYLAAGYDLARRGTWTKGQMAAVALAGLVPFLTFVVEHLTTKRVREELSRQPG